MLKRTHYCAHLDDSCLETSLTVSGWLFKKRILGKLVFLVLRDISGTLQVVFDSQKESWKNLVFLPLESCLSIKGVLKARPKEMQNSQMQTGSYELLAKKFEIFSVSKTPVFPLENPDQNLHEELRLEYRYLDLRQQNLTHNLKIRSQTEFLCHRFFDNKGFLNISTPTFVRSTPEGARDYLVPSRTHAGTFFALAQSPQLYKQLCMIGGLDKYYQICRCYRDEDLRGDRQPEFTQLDVELSFVEQDDIISLSQDFIQTVFQQVLNFSLEKNFPKLTYDKALELYGTDKPDLRFDLLIQDLSSYKALNNIPFIQSQLKQGAVCKGLIIKDSASFFSRKTLDSLSKLSLQYGCKKLAFLKIGKQGLEGSLAKFLNIKEFQDEVQIFCKELKLTENSILLMLCDLRTPCLNALGAIRLKLGQDLKLIDAKKWSFVWVTDFPLFEWNEHEQNYKSLHHPFCMPQIKHLDFLQKEPLKVRGQLYDLVCNGVELASGSIRIHKRALQEQILDILQLSEIAKEQLEFFLRALEFGAPPHGGIAFGLERLVMLLCGQLSLKEVTAFPRTNTGFSPLDKSPNSVAQKHINELLETKLF